jgi:hypothetical protein
MLSTTNAFWRYAAALETTLLLAAAFFFVFASSGFAGMNELATSTSSKTIVPEKKAEANPLCFMDGKVCIDVQERLRFEARQNTFDFDSHTDSLTDDTFLLQRFRVGIAIKPNDWLRIYAQGQDAQELGSDRPDIPGAMGAEGDDSFDLRQGYIQLGPKSFNLTVGRQTLAFGDERLVGIGEWNNFTRTFDAVRLQIIQPKFSIDFFAASVVNIYRDSFNQSDLFNGSETHRDQIFSGIYASTSVVNFQVIDFYLFSLDQEVPNPTAPAITSPATFTGLTGKRTDFVTLGTRIKADPKKLNGLDYEGEFAFQTGKVADLNLTAFAAHVGLGYVFPHPWKPRLFFEYNFATGDNDSTDDEIQTFQNLFPSNHKFYGFMDLFSWQNLHNPAVSVRAQPCKQLTLEGYFGGFWLASTDDAWYRANGVARVRPLNTAARAANSYAGSEIDLLATFAPAKFLTVLAGYSHFFAGDYLHDTGPDDDADFGYVQAVVAF